MPVIKRELLILVEVYSVVLVRLRRSLFIYQIHGVSGFDEHLSL